MRSPPGRRLRNTSGSARGGGTLAGSASSSLGSPRGPSAVALDPSGRVPVPGLRADGLDCFLFVRPRRRPPSARLRRATGATGATATAATPQLGGGALPPQPPARPVPPAPLGRPFRGQFGRLSPTPAPTTAPPPRAASPPQCRGRAGVPRHRSRPRGLLLGSPGVKSELGSEP